MDWVNQNGGRTERWLRKVESKTVNFTVSWRYRRYIYAIVISSILLIVRIRFDSLLTHTPFAIPLIAAVLITYLLGFAAGLIVMVISALAQVYYFELPYNSLSWLKIASSDYKLLGFLFVGLSISGLVALFRAARLRVLEHEKLFRSLIENSSTAVGMMGADGVMNYISPTIAGLLGYQADEIVGTDVLELVHPQDIEFAATEMAKLLEPGRMVVANVRVKHKDGSYRYIECSGNNRLEDPAVRAIVINFNDISSRHQAEEAALQARERLMLANTELEQRVNERTQELSRSEEQYRAMFESLQDIYYRTDQEGVIVLISPSVEANWGYRPEEVMGRKAVEFYYDASEREAMLKQLFDNGSVSDYELRMKNKAGEAIYASLNAHVVRDWAGNMRGVEGVMRDIGHRKQAEEELRREKEFTYGLIESSNDGIVAMDTELKYTAWNPAMEKMTGKLAKEVLGRTSYEMFPFLNAKGITDNFVRPALEGKSSDTGVAEYNIPETGRSGYFEARYSAIRDAAGEIIGVLGSIRDITEKQTAQQALMNSQAALKDAQRLAHIGSWEWDISHDVFTGSDETARIFGIDPEGFALSSQALFQLSHQGDIKMVKKAFERASQDQASFEIDHRISRPEGWVRIVHMQGRPVKGSDGRLIGMRGTMQDITDRKLSEEIVRQSEERFRALAENVNDIILSADSSGNLAYCNPAAERTFGYTAGEILGKPLDKLLPGQGEFLQTLAASDQADSVRQVEVHARHNDGHAFLVELSVASWEAAGENYLITTMRDITERRRDENQLRESEEKFRLLVDGVQDYAIYMLDLEGNIISWNPGAERIKGYKSAEVMGKNFSMFYPPDELAAGKPQRDLAVAAKKGKHEEDAWRIRKSGERFYANVLLAALYNEDGSLRGFAKLTQDFTERKELEQMKGDFVSLVSHQLKTPVALIRGYVENILSGVTEGELSEQQRSYLTDIQEISAKNYGLISDLLNVSRIERGVISLDIKPVKLRDVLHLALRGNQQRIEQKGLKLEVRHSDPEVMIVADKFKMAEAIANIVDNSIKFTEVGAITIQSYTRDDWLNVEISDTGRGIDQAMIDKLFTRDQVFNGSPRPDSGSGLGLYIARQFMRMQKGDVEVTQQPGPGTKFTFRIRPAKVKSKKVVMRDRS